MTHTANRSPNARSYSPAKTSDLLISVLMPPVLVTLLGGRAIADILRQLGQISEQLYRGERLPALTIPTSDPPDQV